MLKVLLTYCAWSLSQSSVTTAEHLDQEKFFVTSFLIFHILALSILIINKNFLFFKLDEMKAFVARNAKCCDFRKRWLRLRDKCKAMVATHKKAVQKSLKASVERVF